MNVGKLKTVKEYNTSCQMSLKNLIYQESQNIWTIKEIEKILLLMFPGFSFHVEKCDYSE